MSEDKKLSFFEANRVRVFYMICFAMAYGFGYSIGCSGSSTAELVKIEREKLDVLKGISKRLSPATSTKSVTKSATVPASPTRNVLRESPQSTPGSSTRMRLPESVRPSIETTPGTVPGGGKIFPMESSPPRYYNPGSPPGQPVAIPPGVPVSSFEVIKPRPDTLLAQTTPKECGCKKKAE